MRIQNNIMALNTYRQYNSTNGKVAAAAEKLSSGLRINRAGDDAAGLAISEKMRAQIRGLNMASKNSLDAVSMVQTAEGALQETHNILQRMRELAVQSGSDTNEQNIDRGALQAEFAQLKQEIDDIASKTRFNDQNILDGSFQKYKSSVNLATGTSFTSDGVMSIMADRSAGGTHTVTVKVNAPVAASNTAGVAAGIVAADSDLIATHGTAPATAAAGVNNLGGLAVTFAGANTGDHNGNTYTLSVSGASAEAMTFQLINSNGEVVSSLENVDMTSWSSNAIDLNFGGVGKFTLTKDANTSITKDASGANAVMSMLSGKKIAFDNAGATPTSTPAQRGSIDLSIGGDTVRLYMGDTTAVFQNAGIELSFSAITDADITAGTFAKFTGSAIRVDQTVGKAMVIQAGANQGDELAINIDAMNTRMLGIATSKIDTRVNASKAITEVNTAINTVSTQRAALGALQNRLNHKIANLDNSAENLTAAESRIRDIDMAKEMTNFTKENIKVQAGIAMLAQANAQPQNVLQLLG